MSGTEKKGDVSKCQIMDNLQMRAHEQRLFVLERSRESPRKFLQAWLKGVDLIGWQFFKHSKPDYMPKLPRATCIEEVKDKWQVCPDYEYVHEYIHVMSSGQKVLLAAMCSFFNPGWGGDLLHDVGVNGLADISGKLDIEGTEIVSDLLIYYNGW